MSNKKMQNKAQNQTLGNATIPSRFSLWWIRTFKVITSERAKELRLKHSRNVHGDEINVRNCRSIWHDNANREYRVSCLGEL